MTNQVSNLINNPRSQKKMENPSCLFLSFLDLHPFHFTPLQPQLIAFCYLLINYPVTISHLPHFNSSLVTYYHLPATFTKHHKLLLTHLPHVFPPPPQKKKKKTLPPSPLRAPPATPPPPAARSRAPFGAAPGWPRAERLPGPKPR